MSFDFFTLGGRSCWEDIFFYQKWRIQRHIDAKTYRLLDPWDISRAEGSFEKCRKQFVKYIEVYEISRQNKEMIIMLHGLGGTKKVFRPLWQKAIKRGFLAAALNFPSTKKSIDSHVRQFDFFLNHLEDVTEVSFIAKGVSCLILRKLLSMPSLWQKKIKIKRILFVNPANSGSDIISWLAKNRLFRWLLGPMSTEVSNQKAILIPRLPSNIEQGTIFCDSIFKKIGRFFTKPFESIPIIDESTEEGYVVKAIYLNHYWGNVFKDKKVVDAAITFLEKGKFK